MQTKMVYCSACDHDVPVVVTDQPVQDGQATVFDSELVCLAIGEWCTGTMCPLCALPPSAMAERLVRNGLVAERPRTLRALCSGCDRVTELIATPGGYVTCSECGTTWRRLPGPGESPLH